MAADESLRNLARQVREGDIRAIARALSIAEGGDSATGALLGHLHARAGRAAIVGVTGSAGSGKSTLVDRFVAHLRATGERVAVLAVDPSSPFTGGALLGDRVRMQGHAGDEGVFIRSVATRGHVGGLAKTTADAIIVLDAAGFDTVIVETVGVGQGEVEIARLADTTVVVVVPGAGDDVQALKAGLMEIADVFVVNKADRDGADKVALTIDSMLSLADTPTTAWRPPVLTTVATEGRGIVELAAAIASHRVVTPDVRARRRRARDADRLRALVVDAALERIDARAFEAQLDRISTGAVDHHRAARVLAADVRHAMSIDHVGIAATSFDAGLAFLVDVLGWQADSPEDVPSQRVQIQFAIPSAETSPAVELVVPTDRESPIAAFLERRGPGLHHLAIRVPDLDGLLVRLRSRGVRLIDDEPRPGAHGTRVAFVHPAAAGGVLIELVDRGARDADR